jgi:hypothetical protein
MNEAQAGCLNIGEDDDDDDVDDDDDDTRNNNTPLSLNFNRPNVNKLCIQEVTFCVKKTRTSSSITKM